MIVHRGINVSCVLCYVLMNDATSTSSAVDSFSVVWNVESGARGSIQLFGFGGFAGARFDSAHENSPIARTSVGDRLPFTRVFP